MMAQILPAILTDDLSILRRQLAAASQWTDRVHVDIGDGVFIHRQTVGVSDVLALDPSPAIEFHLMVAQPEQMVAAACRRPTDTAVVHYEAPGCRQLLSVGWHDRLGVAINPQTELEQVDRLSGVRHWLIMGVTPGAQGNPYHPSTPARLEWVRQHFPTARLSVDGGMDRTTIPAAVRAGAADLVVGHAIWQVADPSQAFRDLAELAAAAL